MKNENIKMPIKLVTCPTCNKQVEWSDKNPWRPFCSERCRIIDLGDWADEKHKIPDETPADFMHSDSDENA